MNNKSVFGIERDVQDKVCECTLKRDQLIHFLDQYKSLHWVLLSTEEAVDSYLAMSSSKATSPR